MYVAHWVFITASNIVVVRSLGYQANSFVGSNGISRCMFYPSYATTGHAQDVHFLGDIQSTTMEKICALGWGQVAL
jgi:hypothetical protein